jgi:hypothetical protein
MNCAMLSLAIGDVIDEDDSTFAPWLHRWRKAENVYNYLDEHEHYPVAHIDPTTPPSGYNAGAGRTWGVNFETYGDEYSPQVTKAIVHAISRKWRVEHAPNWNFNGNVNRWVARGSASIAYDSGDGSALVTVSGAGGGIGNVTADWTGSEPGSYDTTGHILLKGGTTYDVQVIAKRGTYPASALTVTCICGATNSATSTISLTGSYVSLPSITFTPAADGRMDIKVGGSGSNTGTFNVSAISVKPR